MAAGEMIVHRAPAGSGTVQVRASVGTVWLTCYQMDDLYDMTRENIIQIVKLVLTGGKADPATTNSELVVHRELARAGGNPQGFLVGLLRWHPPFEATGRLFRPGVHFRKEK
ncbi:MAG: hypothetical protein LBK42_01535 [Propionibacteriaceae bacterium]|jgi:hypothetical protein|nr:hypothetical protein [Propionibacteriaceae bacterium]